MHLDSLKFSNHESTTNLQIVEVNRFQKPQVLSRILLNGETHAVPKMKNDSPGFEECSSSKASGNHSQHAQNPRKSVQVIQSYIRACVLFGQLHGCPSALLHFQKFCFLSNPIPIPTEMKILPAIPK